MSFRAARAAAIPGEVDTGMQADLRAPDPSVFTLAEFFRENEPNLIPVEVAVDFLTWARVHLSGAALVFERGDRCS